MKYANIVAEFYSRVWAIRPEKLYLIDQLIRLRASGQRFTEKEIRQRIGADAFAGPRSQGGSPGTVALIPIVGTISHRMNMMGNISGGGGTSIEKLTSQFRGALADPNVKAIVFDVDSPGGSVDGVAELASEIYDGRKQKPIVAVANAQAASAAYWLASAAKELVVTPSGQVGSIGVFAAHEDLSKALETEGVKVSLVSAGKYKVEGNPYEALSDEARAALQDKVDQYYGMFTRGVAQNRGTSQAKVREGFGQGRMVMAQDAVKQNMADRVATLDEVLAKYGVSSASPARTAAASTGTPIAASDGMDEEECNCSCTSCQACKNMTDDSDPDDDGDCNCSCEACQACENKTPAAKAEAVSGIHSGIARRRREMQLH
jgi:signal peptide peptidase SppA